MKRVDTLSLIGPWLLAPPST